MLIQIGENTRDGRIFKNLVIGSLVTDCYHHLQQAQLATSDLTNTQIQIHKHRYTNTDAQIQMYKYKYTPTY